MAANRNPRIDEAIGQLINRLVPATRDSDATGRRKRDQALFHAQQELGMRFLP